MLSKTTMDSAVLFLFLLVIAPLLASGLLTTPNDAGLTGEASPTAWTVPAGVKFGSLDKLKRLSLDNNNNDDDNNDQGNYDDQDTVAPQVIIATQAIGLNFADIFSVLGLYNAANQVRGSANGPFVPGLEFSGTVVVEDPNDKTFSMGDKVLGFTRFGAYSDCVKARPAYLLPLPDNWTFFEGASFIVQALTAWHGLVEVGRMPNLTNKTERPYVVVVHSAAGGVGLWASEIAARRGAIVIGIVGDDPQKQKAFLERILHLSPRSRCLIRGVEASFGSRLAECLLQIHRDNSDIKVPQDYTSLTELATAGLGADMIMECLGGKYFQASFDCLNSRGALVTYGSTSYVSPGKGLNWVRLVVRYLTRPRIDPGQLTSRNIRLGGFNLIFLTERQDELRQQLQDCIDCLSGGTGELANVTRPVIGRVFDFATETIHAMEYFKGGQTVGKIVLDNANNPLVRG